LFSLIVIRVQLINMDRHKTGLGSISECVVNPNNGKPRVEQGGLGTVSVGGLTSVWQPIAASYRPFDQSRFQPVNMKAYLVEFVYC